MPSAYDVLVFDNDEHIRALLAEIMEDIGYRAHTLPGRTMTFARIARARPKLLIIELHPANADTTMLLLGQLRHSPTTRDCQTIVICSDPRLLEHLALPLQHLRCATLLKPFHLDQLLHLVDTLLNVRNLDYSGDKVRVVGADGFR